MRGGSGLLGLAALAVAGGLGPGQAAAESLSDALKDAFLLSPELAAQRANVKIQSERAVQAAAQGRPQVAGNLDASAQISDIDDFGRFGEDVIYPTTVALSLFQPLYTGGQVENATEAAEKRITAQEAVLVSVEQQALLAAVTAYMDIRRDIDLVAISVNNVDVLGELLDASEERFAVGEVTRTDVEQARARLAAARGLLAAQRGALQASREAFLRAVGRYPGELAPPPPLPDLPDSKEHAIQLALRKDPLVLAALVERDAAGSDVRSAIGRLLPQVSLQAQVQRSDARGDSLPPTERGVVGVNVTLPFYSGGANYAAIREAQAAVEGRAADITAARRDAMQAVGVAWANLDVARASIAAGVLEVRAAELAFEGVREEAKVGARTTLDVLQTEQDLLDARGDLVAARRDEYVAAFELLAAMGLLTVDHLGLEVETGRVAASYYARVKDRNFGYDETDDTVWTERWHP
ncbi:MAG TPA: TolC family outer membrane protein [Thermohalobaculum sp.]|nr:TolC family outer membrane protein [Thermohalobaculum sp.]